MTGLEDMELTWGEGQATAQDREEHCCSLMSHPGLGGYYRVDGEKLFPGVGYPGQGQQSLQTGAGLFREVVKKRCFTLMMEIGKSHPENVESYSNFSKLS